MTALLNAILLDVILNLVWNSSEHTSNRRVLVTGAGSGTGAAAALQLSGVGELVLVGRRREKLEDVAAQVSEAGGAARVVPWDVTRTDTHELLAQAGPVTDLVLSAGLNAPKRAWSDQRMPEFRSIIETNLVSVADVVTHALPSIRAAHGTIVVVSSLSAWTTSPGAGVAYRASKGALRALTDSLNEQEAVHGVRATLICPGDIDSEFLAHRPAPPSAEPRKSMLSPDDVATAITFAFSAPRHLRIDELVLSPLGTVQR